MHDPLNEFKHIKEVSHSARISPPDELWTEVKDKLDTHATARSTYIKKKINLLGKVAAAALLLACCLYVFQESNRSTEMGVGHIAGWEELKIESDNFYDTRKLHQLYNAYVSSGH